MKATWYEYRLVKKRKGNFEKLTRFLIKKNANNEIFLCSYFKLKRQKNIHAYTISRFLSRNYIYIYN